MATVTHEIVDGPSKFDIMVSLFDGEKDKRKTVNFSLGWHGYVLANLQAVISGVSRKYLHGGEWTITGRGKLHIEHKTAWESHAGGRASDADTDISFTASYSTSVRKGEIEFQE